MAYLLFVSRPTGYELREQDGDAPAVGAMLELDEREGEPPQVGSEVEEDGSRFTVIKLAVSPLPGDTRRCAYLQPLS